MTEKYSTSIELHIPGNNENSQCHFSKSQPQYLNSKFNNCILNFKNKKLECSSKWKNSSVHEEEKKLKFLSSGKSR
jgi:hypothetical protein